MDDLFCALKDESNLTHVVSLVFHHVIPYEMLIKTHVINLGCEPLVILLLE